MNSMAMLFKKEKAKGSEVHWGSVYQEYLPRIYNFFRFRVGDDAVAEDLTSAAFEKAWRARSGFQQERAEIATWLFAIARNVAIDHFRRTRHEVDWEAAEEMSDPFSVEEHFQRTDEARRLNILLMQLSLRDRELIALKYGAEMNNREIAQLMGLSESNVGTIVNRVVMKLRSAWETNHE